jgi:hypothetical protein
LVLIHGICPLFFSILMFSKNLGENRADAWFIPLPRQCISSLQKHPRQWSGCLRRIVSCPQHPTSIQYKSCSYIYSYWLQIHKIMRETGYRYQTYPTEGCNGGPPLSSSHSILASPHIWSCCWMLVRRLYATGCHHTSQAPALLDGQQRSRVPCENRAVSHLGLGSLTNL